jgi:outer membrane receptor protein involved in Fe transport
MTRPGSARERWFLLCCSLAAALAASASPVLAQHGCAIAPIAPAPHAWPSPLDRLVSIQARDVALRDALERLSAASATPFAYASDLLALDRRVCLVAERRPLGDLLDLLVAGSGVAPSVVAGRVVLVPRTSRAPVPASTERVNVLDRVVVTGNTIATARRALPIGVEVIDGEVLRARGLGSLSEILDGAVPGAWMWGASSSSLLAQYGGIRGASSFGTSSPKIYVDGIEVANPLLVTQLDPDAIDRIEIIRGPQGSALYGSDAISGVINVLTRHDGRPASGSRLQLSSVAGASSSAYGTSLVATHEQRLALRLGSSIRSAGLAAQFGQTGAVFPSAESRTSSLVADARVTGARSILSGSARLLDRRLGPGQNPLLVAITTDSATALASAVLPAQSSRQYTVGGSLAVSPDGMWTHSIVLGLDGYRVSHVDGAASLYPVPADSSMYALRGAGDRTTLRASSVGQFGGDSGGPATTLTLGLEQSVLRQVAPTSQRWNHNSGAFVQFAAGWDDAFFLSGGIRVEQNDAITGTNQHALLPMLGVASVHEIGPASLKLRAAYGRGIRPPSTPARGMPEQGTGSYGLESALEPESQSGTEIGAELYLGKVASLHLTRFDQTASDLIQNVLLGMDTSSHGGPSARRSYYQLQNVGEIGNHGWEVQGTVTTGALTLAGAFTTVDSRVRSVASRYAGEMRPGDRMLGVPARTGSLTASWAAHDWSAAVSASRAASWVNYDRLALARDYAAAGGTGDLSGARLRDYWIDYSGETHLRVTTTRTVRTGIDLVVSGDNLLGGQLGEPDNVTIRAGRTIMAGLRAGF